MQKDLRLALDMARASAVVLPSVALTHELLTAAKGMGLAHYDFAILFDVLAQMAALPPSKKL
jgi:3-hydroxyisobutyrate dehydrogenase-like beta-hydroxyacid dehydrogenase